MTQPNTWVLISAFACTFALDVRADLWIQVNSLDATCGNPTGSANVFVSGGTPPYTFLWSNGGITPEITGLAAGIYSVTVTDAVSDELTGQVTVQNLPTPTLMYQGPGASLHGCHGQCNNGLWYYQSQMPQNLVAPFTFSNPPITGVNPFTPEDSAWVGFCDGWDQFITNVTDGNGCVASLTTGWFPDVGSDPGPMSLVSTTPSCDGMAAGSMTVNVGLESNNAYTPLWNATLLDESMQPVAGHPLFAKPMLDQNVELEQGLPPGDYFVERRFQNFQGDCVDLLPVTIPSLGTNCGAVSGTAFLDYNENCQNNSEPTVPYGILEVQPGPVYATLNGGPYIICLPPGNYTMEQTSSDVAEHCTGAPIPFTIMASAIPVQVNLPDTSLVTLDLGVSIYTGPARPGFQFGCGINIQNTTPNASGAITLTMDFDATLSYVSSMPAAGNVSGNTITWNLPQLTGWQSTTVLVQFSVPANPGLIGTQLVNSVSVSSMNLDDDLANNSASATTLITGSVDPNEKVARTSSGLSSDLYYIDEDEWIDYTIRFQNTGTDTAFNILITDTLQSTLDPSTLVMGASSHTFSWELRDAGTLKFFFQNILLVDSNYSEPLSQGFVGFRIRPRTPMLPGTIIENTANIYFDFNDRVITEPSMLTAEFSTGIIERDKDVLLYPNPALNSIAIRGMGKADWVIIGIDGRRLASGKFTSEPGAVDIGSLNEGSYLIQLLTAHGRRTIPFDKCSAP